MPDRINMCEDFELLILIGKRKTSLKPIQENRRPGSALYGRRIEARVRSAALQAPVRFNRVPALPFPIWWTPEVSWPKEICFSNP